MSGKLICLRLHISNRISIIIMRIVIVKWASLQVYFEEKGKDKKDILLLFSSTCNVTLNFKLYDECNRCALQLLNKYTLLIHLVVARISKRSCMCWENDKRTRKKFIMCRFFCCCFPISSYFFSSFHQWNSSAFSIMHFLLIKKLLKIPLNFLPWAITFLSALVWSCTLLFLLQHPLRKRKRFSLQNYFLSINSLTIFIGVFLINRNKFLQFPTQKEVQLSNYQCKSCKDEVIKPR